MYYAEQAFAIGFVGEMLFFIVKEKIFFLRSERKRAVACCFLFGILAVSEQFFPLTVHYLRLASCLVIVPFICIPRNIKSMFFTFCLQVLHAEITLPVFFSILACALVISLSFLLRFKRGIDRRFYPCTVRVGDIIVSTVAFFDSGNRLRKEGKPVVMCDGRIYKKFYGEEEIVGFSTVSGVGTTKCLDGEVCIRSGGKKYVYNALVACSPQNLHQCGLILNGEMLGGI